MACSLRCDIGGCFQYSPNVRLVSIEKTQSVFRGGDENGLKSDADGSTTRKGNCSGWIEPAQLRGKDETIAWQDGTFN
jgi:hypothetical protein